MLQTSLQRYRFLPKQPKENTGKITNLPHFLDLDYHLQVCLSYISANVATFLSSPLGLSKNLSPNFHCSHMDGNCYDEPQIAVGHFKRYFKYTLYIIISMNIVMYSSKDGSFNQNLAYLWSFLSISAFVSIIFCNFAVKQL